MVNYQQGLEERRQQYEEGKKALPEPQWVKRNILQLWVDTREARKDFIRRRDERSLQDLKERVIEYYYAIRVYVTSLPPEKSDKYSELENIQKPNIRSNNESSKWLKWANMLDDLLFDLGVTDIGINTKSYNYGLEIFNGAVIQPHVTKKIRRWMNWHKLQANFTALKYHLVQQDMDGFVLIWGANRAGKSTLAIHLMDLVNSGEISKKNFVNNDEDFYEATEELNEGQSYLVDEVTNIFDRHDTRKSKQNKRIKKLETYAKRNMLGFGCTVNFFRIDKSLYSKLAAAIKITGRGNFEFYSPSKIEEFKRDRQMKVVKTPAPEYRGKFPKRDDKVWEKYKNAIEDDKIFNKKKEDVRRDEEDKPSKKELIKADIEEMKENDVEVNKEKLTELKEKYDTSINYIRKVKSENV